MKIIDYMSYKNTYLKNNQLNNNQLNKKEGLRGT